MYLNKLDHEIDKLLKKKEKLKTYEPATFKLDIQKDWRG